MPTTSTRSSRSGAPSNPESWLTCARTPSIRWLRPHKTASTASAATPGCASPSYGTPACAYNRSPPAIPRPSLDRVVDVGPVGDLGHLHHLLGRGHAEEHAPVGQGQAKLHG